MEKRPRSSGVALALVLWMLAALTAPRVGHPTEVSAQGPGTAPGRIPAATGSTPHSVLYQGYVTLSGAPYEGAGYFKFAVVNENATAVYWSNDGTLGVPTVSVPIDVLGGYFTVLLGDTSLSGMREELAPGVFEAPGRYLKVWFATSLSGPFNALSPVPIAAAPYALNAETLDGAEGSAFQRRVLKNCTAGSSIRAIHGDGTVTCAPDDDTTYAPGNQLQLAGTTFHVTEGTGSGLDADLLDGQQGSYYRNADQVDGFDANQLASTAAYAGGNQTASLDTTDAVLRYVTITALRAGWILVNASLYVYHPADGDYSRCSITTGTALDSNALVVASNAGYASIAATRGYTVGAGTYRFNLVCDANSDQVIARDTNITAVYVPGSFAALASPDASPAPMPIPEGCVDENGTRCEP